MSQAGEANPIDLFSRLCEGNADLADAEQLNQLFAADPLLQEEYLDQLMVHGLLMQEYRDRGSVPIPLPEATTTRDWIWNRFYSTSIVVLLVALGGAVGWSLRSAEWEESAIQLVNSSFEWPMSVRYQPVMSGWYGDAAQYVRQSNRIVPADGKQMLRFVKSINHPEDRCEVYQIIDLGGLPRPSTDQPLLVEAKALVNSQAENDQQKFVFAVHMYALTESPLELSESWPEKLRQDVSYVASQLTADHDLSSWQEISSVIAIRPEARYLVLELSVRDVLDPHRVVFPGQFVDRVQVSLKTRGL